MAYSLVVCGGTFDHFHKGHKEFLRFALSKGKKLLLGITDDEFVAKKANESSIEPYLERKQAVEDFLTRKKVSDRVEIVSINTIFIPKMWEELPIEAIIVTKDTKKGAEIVNKDRQKRGLVQLPVIEVPEVAGEDGKIISSSRIRAGEINREGKPYVNPIWLERDLVLPEEVREELKKPLGELIADVKRWFVENSVFSAHLITVGDVITQKGNEEGLRQNISVVDFYVKREKKFSNFSELGFDGSEEVFDALNPRGTITAELFGTVQKALQNKTRVILKVEGEEDLAVLPFVLCAPLGFTILYGQPGEGVVAVAVTEHKKDSVYNLVSRFTLRTRGH